MYVEILKFTVPALVAVVGWFVAHQFNAHRDRLNKRRELRIQFMLDAYCRLEASANRGNQSEEQKKAFESAVADIQLLGTPEQALATVRYLGQHAAHGDAQIDSVLKLLREDLRKEIGLKGKVEDPVFFRFTDKP